MKALKDARLFNLIREYFTEYLPRQHRVRPNTIRAYQSSIELLLDYVKTSRGVRMTDITFDMIDKSIVVDFIEWLEKERGASIATRNLRLAAIRTFFSYAADCDSSLLFQASKIGKIETIKRCAKQQINYMSEKAVQVVLDEPDSKTELGLRDRMMLVMLYDTAGRIQEVLDIRLRDLRLVGSSMVTLLGKNGKPRNVSLMEGTVKHLKQYLEIFHPNVDMHSDAFLFYIKRKDGSKRMTEDNARKRVQAYGETAHRKYSGVPAHLHPHLFRHSRAMHLYQHGMPLALVSQWLGHSEVETTEIYAYADTEMKRKAIEAATPSNSPLKQYLNAARYTENDEETIKLLYGLK